MEQDELSNKKPIETSEAPLPSGPYSQAIVSDGFIFCTGQIAQSLESNDISGTVAEQTEQIIKNIKAVLSAANSNLENVIKVTVFLIDMKDFSEMNEVYKKHFFKPFPARSTVCVQALAANAKLEVEVIAKVTH